MNKFVLPLLVAGALLATPSFAQKSNPKAAAAVAKNTNGAASYAVQPQLSSLGWLAKKVGGQHNGSVAVKDGAVQVKGDQIIGGTFTFDMTTIKVEDLKDPNYNAKLVGHLNSDDFFSTAKNPTATFVITSVKPIQADAAGNNAEVTGNLTIKGITKPLTFPAKVGVKSGVASASGTAVVDRTKYDVKYGSTMFGTAVDKAIEDNFTMTFNVIAKK